MRLLFQAIINVLTAATPPTPLLGGVLLGQEWDIENADRPLIRLSRMGGDSPPPVAGVDDPYIVLQVRSRKSPDEAIQIYDWASALLNQRHRDLTAQMGGNGQCWTFIRQWRSEPLFDDTTRDWYVAVRYYAIAVDFADLHSAWGGVA